MLELSSNRTAPFCADEENSVIIKVNRFLEELSHGLETEICNAILDGKIDLAERLNLHFIRAKRLAQSFYNLSSGNC